MENYFLNKFKSFFAHEFDISGNKIVETPPERILANTVVICMLYPREETLPAGSIDAYLLWTIVVDW